MSKSESRASGPRRAVALQYETADSAPVIVASGMGYLAEKIVEVAADNGVPVYEDNSLATILSQLQLGQEVPPALYQAIVEIYVYFLEFDPTAPDGRRPRPAPQAEVRPDAAPQPDAQGADKTDSHQEVTTS